MWGCDEAEDGTTPTAEHMLPRSVETPLDHVVQFASVDMGGYHTATSTRLLGEGNLWEHGQEKARLGALSLPSSLARPSACAGGRGRAAGGR